MGKYISVNPGDEVTVQFSQSFTRQNPKPQQALVLSVKRRYGRVNNGRTPLAPLVTVRFLSSGKEDTFDNSFITKLTKRNTRPQPPINIYTKLVEKGCFIQSRGSTWEGTLRELAIFALSKLPVVERPLDEEKLLKLYRRQCHGMLGRYRSVYRVNRYRFMDWIRRNHLRICSTVQELTERETASEMKMAVGYRHDIEADLEAGMYI